MNLGYALLSVFIVSLVSFVGVISLSFKKIKHVLLWMVSFAAGSLIGDAFIHLLPEVSGSVTLSFAVLSGIVASFIIEKFIHWHHCHHHEDCEHGKHAKPMAYVNLFGDGVHNFIDGLIIGASYLVNVPTGIATTVAVVLHEIPQELGDFAILLHAGFSKAKAVWYNFLTACTAILGTLAAFLIADLGPMKTILIGFAAGNFIYIALADLVPELHKETRLWNSLIQLFFFIAGIGFMALLLMFE